jgi:hypothetical protein
MANLSTRKILVDQLWKLLGQSRVTWAASPPARSNRRDHFFADGRRGDEGNESLVLVVQYGGLDLFELRLKNVLNGLYSTRCRRTATESVRAGFGCRFLFVSGRETAELRCVMNFSVFLRQVAVPACNVHPTDTKLTNLSVG